jgi:hypothetical protein
MQVALLDAAKTCDVYHVTEVPYLRLAYSDEWCRPPTTLLSSQRSCLLPCNIKSDRLIFAHTSDE